MDSEPPPSSEPGQSSPVASSPPPLTGGQPAVPPKKSYKGCIIAGCGFALLGFVLLLGVVGFAVYKGNSSKFGSGENSTVTSQFDPANRPELAIGKGGEIGKFDWPTVIGDYGMDDVMPKGIDYFVKPIGGARYAYVNGNLEGTLVILPYSGSQGFNDLVNGTIDFEFPDGGAKITMAGGLTIFSHESQPASIYTVYSLRDHAVFVKLTGVSDKIPSIDELKEFTQLSLEKLGKPSSSAPVSSSSNSESSEVMSYDRGNDRELELSPGPAVEDEIDWPTPDASEEFFSLTRSEYGNSPAADQGFNVGTASYSALNFEDDVRRTINFVFFHPDEGESIDLLFTRVVDAISSLDKSLKYDGVVAFYITDEETHVHEVAEQVYSTDIGGGVVIFSAFSNGVLVCMPDAAADGEPDGAFPPVAELGDQLIRLVATKCFDASKGL